MADDPLKMFVERYQSGDAPWDTGITPPEIVQLIAELPPGRALDLGCGTGTNVAYLLQHGWQADGVDFVPQAVELARHKLSGFSAENSAIHCHDVTRLDSLAGLRAPYDLVIDIGCGHGVAAEDQAKYAHDIAALLRMGGIFMLYAIQPTEERAFGWTPHDVERIFAPHFSIFWQAHNVDTASGYPSGWYRLHKMG